MIVIIIVVVIVIVAINISIGVTASARGVIGVIRCSEGCSRLVEHVEGESVAVFEKARDGRGIALVKHTRWIAALNCVN